MLYYYSENGSKCIILIIKKMTSAKEVNVVIDIHSNILPGVDDGAKTEEESLKMARAAVDQGIHTIIATPHHKNVHFDNEKASILKQVDILRDLLVHED